MDFKDVMLGQLYGMPIIWSDHANTVTGGPTIKHKPWHKRGCYFERIKKKQIKKNGPTVYTPAILKVKNLFGRGYCFVIHPSLKEKLGQTLDTGNRSVAVPALKEGLNLHDEHVEKILRMKSLLHKTLVGKIVNNNVT